MLTVERGIYVIKGIGIDLCSISRMKSAVERKGFTERVFSAEEIEYAENSACPEEHYAASFAAREALAKALKCGLWKLGVNDVFVKRTENGPEFVLNKQRPDGVSRVFLSLSHENDCAAAFVVAEGE